MSYSLPLRFIKVSQKRSDNRQFDVSVCATRIIAIMSTDIYQARKTISDERKNGTLINAAGLTKAKSAIFMDNGSVIASPLAVNRLMSQIEKSNTKAGSGFSRKVKVYDVTEPEEDEAEETEDVSAYYDLDDEDFIE